MKCIADGWNQFFYREAPPHILAVVRIVFGAWLLFRWGIRFPSVPLLFSDGGTSVHFFTNGLPDFLLYILLPPPPWVAWIIFCTFYAMLILFTIGALMRVSVSVVLILYFYYWNLDLHHFFMTFERLYVFFLIVLLFSGADKTFSWHIWRKRGSFFAWEPCSILPQRILALQLSATYMGVSFQKLWLPDWQGGKVLIYSFLSRWATPITDWMVRLHLPLWFYDFAVWSVKIPQCSMFLGLWIPRWQWLFFAAGLLFHIQIFVLLSMWWFLIMVPAYITFLSPEKFYEFVKSKSKGKIP
jgi:hypothetical protein